MARFRISIDCNGSRYRQTDQAWEGYGSDKADQDPVRPCAACPWLYRRIDMQRKIQAAIERRVGGAGLCWRAV